MLATEVSQPPVGSNWSFEYKVDGVRAILILQNGSVSLKSRRGVEMLKWFPEISQIATSIKARDAIVDGEIVLGDGSMKSFNTLLSRVRARRRRPTDEPITYVAFDLLATDGASIVDHPLDDRRTALNKIIHQGPGLAVSRVFTDGPALYHLALLHGMEGVIAKDRTSSYRSGRSRSWLKIKVPNAAAEHDWSGSARSSRS
jgi:bifunctional non-homologous end joining protein LigD